MGGIFKGPKMPKQTKTEAMPEVKPQTEEVAIREQRRRSGFEQTLMGRNPMTGKRTTLG